MDALIAAIARETDASLATQDIDDFMALELILVDPGPLVVTEHDSAGWKRLPLTSKSRVTDPMRC